MTRKLMILISRLTILLVVLLDMSSKASRTFKTLFPRMTGPLLMLFASSFFVMSSFAGILAQNSSPQIKSLVNETTMTEYAQHLFYLNNPTITDDKKFIAAACSHDEAQEAATLGCYKKEANTIYILNMPDSRLKGVMDTAAAHETLHVAYQRLDSQEKARVDKLLAQVLAGSAHAELSLKLKSYGKASSSQLRNELHSFVGTEILHLPPELEAYYAKYFTDRKKLVFLGKKPEAEFEVHGKEIKDYDQKLVLLRSKIKSKKVQGLKLSQELITLQNLQAAYLQRGDAQSYNKLVPQINNKIIVYNNVAKDSQTFVHEYNELVKRRNRIAQDANNMAAMMSSDKKKSSLESDY